ncbi:RBR-type E3 ubiquitin transferase [Mycena chlorophos]|uniref:RBR-type E3 ubiquitin transferase n=1 Tax=Mycena chlorophos TaxID=658473 RepID=A0A8H6TKU5_MYCCL|nr:RBR-type E3 ubiquitin transferase [Mycena chlorophos]
MAYYLAKGNEKELFEDNQHDLERPVEEPSELIESALDPKTIPALHQKVANKMVSQRDRARRYRGGFLDGAGRGIKITHGQQCIRMIFTKDLPTSLKHLFLQLQSICMPSQLTVCSCQVAHGPQCVRMIFTKDLPASSKHLFLQLQSICMPSKLPICCSKITHGQNCIKVICTKSVPVQFKHLIL